MLAGSALLSVWQGEERWISWLLAALGVGVQLSVPAELLIDGRGIEQRRPFGLLPRRFEWGDVDHAIAYPNQVYGNFTQPSVNVLHRERSEVIKHTAMHADRSRFVRELRKRTKVHGVLRA